MICARDYEVMCHIVSSVLSSVGSGMNNVIPNPKSSKEHVYYIKSHVNACAHTIQYPRRPIQALHFYPVTNITQTNRIKLAKLVKMCLTAKKTKMVIAP